MGKRRFDDWLWSHSITADGCCRPSVAEGVKVLREVEVEKLFQGTIGFLEVSFPLWVAPQPASASQPTTARNSPQRSGRGL